MNKRIVVLAKNIGGKYCHVPNIFRRNYVAIILFAMVIGACVSSWGATATWDVTVMPSATSVVVCVNQPINVGVTAAITGTPPSTNTQCTVSGPSWCWSGWPNAVNCRRRDRTKPCGPGNSCASSNVVDQSFDTPGTYTITVGATACYTLTPTSTAYTTICSSPQCKTGTAAITVTVIQVMSVDWEAVPEADDGAPLDGGKIFAEKKTPTGSLLNKVKAKATLSPAVPPGKTFTVYFKVFDMDDPSSNPIIDPNDTATEHKGDDNLPSPGGMTPEGIVAVTISVPATATAGQDTVKQTYSVTERQPGNNWKVVASCCSACIADTIIDTSTGSTFKRKMTGKPIPPSTPMLTEWRTLNVERDSMAAPILPQDGPFRGAGQTGAGLLPGDDDVQITPDDPNIGLLNNYEVAYIKSKDLGTLNVRNKTIPFKHNLLQQNAFNTGNSSRDQKSNKDFWVVQIVGAYEGNRDETQSTPYADNDPNTEGYQMGYSPQPGSDGPCLIYLETIRDVSVNRARSKSADVIVPRIVLHESAHRFHMVHGIAPGDAGPLSEPNNRTGSPADNEFTPVQIRVIRKVEEPK